MGGGRGVRERRCEETRTVYGRDEETSEVGEQGGAANTRVKDEGKDQCLTTDSDSLTPHPAKTWPI